MAAHRNEQYDKAVQMYEGGKSIQQIAELFKVSRQSMHSTLKRRGVVFRSNKRFGDENHFYRNSIPKDARVHSIVSKEIARGRLLSKPCDVCGSNENIEGHHDDYNKPLDIRWLCKLHHYEWHCSHTPIPRTIELPPMNRPEICSLGGQASPTKFRKKA